MHRSNRYDAGFNLNARTDNGVATTFTVDGKNQLTGGPTSPYTYDANGNLTGAGSVAYGYDDENQLTSLTTPGSAYTLWTYDGVGRLRKQQEYTWTSGAGSTALASSVSLGRPPVPTLSPWKKRLAFDNGWRLNPPSGSPTATAGFDVITEQERLIQMIGSSLEGARASGAEFGWALAGFLMLGALVLLFAVLFWVGRGGLAHHAVEAFLPAVASIGCTFEVLRRGGW